MTPDVGIRVIVRPEDITALFVASNGQEVALDVLAVTSELDPGERRTMIQWCRDRLSDAALPADVRRQIEAKIERVATKRL